MSLPLPSRIDSRLTPNERRVLSMYSNPEYSGVGRTVRLAVQYALRAGLFTVLCIERDEPL